MIINKDTQNLLNQLTEKHLCEAHDKFLEYFQIHHPKLAVNPNEFRDMNALPWMLNSNINKVLHLNEKEELNEILNKLAQEYINKVESIT